AFVEAGADITFLEAPLSEEEMIRYCAETPGYKMVNMLPSGKTPFLPHQRLHEI
ncbi:Dml, partial [Symbiodinium sp. CCMP2456]